MAQPFPQDVVDQAFKRSGGKCECKRSSHNHGSRCSRQLIKNKRGSESSGGWEAHHINSNGPATLSNCEILCQPCHKATRSYGG